jgi:hypothetical protein
VIRTVVGGLAPPGIMRNLSLVTAQAFQTETNLDNLILGYEEFKTSWLFGTANEKDKGATQEINQVKSRLTSFFSETWAPHIDDATGRRTLVSSKSSQHNVTIGGTNQFLADMDRNVGRRFLLYTMPKHLAAGEGSDALDMTVIEAFTNSELGRRMANRFQQVHAVVIFLSCLVKTGVLPDMCKGDAELQLEAVCDELRANRFVNSLDKTRRHYVMQLARNAQVWFVAWLILYSPFAYAYHTSAADEPASRWSPEAILTLAVPLWKVTRESLIYALTLTEPIFAPVYVEQTLRALVTECLRLDADVKDWPFYYEMHAVQKVKTYDCNYVMLTGQHAADICGFIARQNKEYLLREADVERELRALGEQHIKCSSYEATATADDGHPLGIVLVNDRREQRRALRFERHPERVSKTALVVSLAFLKERLDVDLLDPAAVAALRTVRQPHELKRVQDPAFIDAYGRVPLTPDEAADTGRVCSPIATSINKALSNNLFERAPTLEPFLRDPATGRVPPPQPFMTAYVVEPLSFFMDKRPPTPDAMDVDGSSSAPAAPAAPRAVRTLALHATHTVLPLRCDPGRQPPRRENHTRPLATGKRFFAAFESMSSKTDAGPDDMVNAAAVRARRFNETLGIYAAGEDPEASFSADLMRQMCHPGFRFAEALLFDGSDPAAPRPSVVPYAYGPVLACIFRRLAERNGDLAAEAMPLSYPYCNIMERVNETLHLDKDRRNGTNDAHASYAEILGETIYGGICFDLQ